MYIFQVTMELVRNSNSQVMLLFPYCKSKMIISLFGGGVEEIIHVHGDHFTKKKNLQNRTQPS